MANRTDRGSALDRIKKKTVYKGDCFIYTGQPSMDKENKAPIIHENKVYYPSIGNYAWRKLVGPLHGDNIVCHTCDNPRCWNIKHLYEGTFRKNRLDMVRRGRQGNYSNPGELHPIASITNNTAAYVKLMIEVGMKSGLIAKRLKIPAYIVYSIKTGNSWAHVEIDNEFICENISSITKITRRV